MPHSSGSDSSRAGDHLVDALVTDAEGNQGSIASIEQADADRQAWVRLEQGTRVLVPVSLLAAQADGTYRLPFTFHVSDARKPSAQMTFPVMEEELHGATRVVDTGRGVRVRKTVSGREQTLDQTLLRDELEVEHIPVGRVVGDADPPQTRYEGNTLVVPVLEEVLVVQKQLLLKEEVHITRHRRPVRVPQSVALRSEQVTVERFDEDRGAQGSDTQA